TGADRKLRGGETREPTIQGADPSHQGVLRAVGVFPQYGLPQEGTRSKAAPMSAGALTLPGDVVPRAAAAMRRLRMCHIMSADLWAGAEVQVATTAASLVNAPGVKLSAVLLNEGQLAVELRRLGVVVAVVDETRTNALAIVIALVRFLRKQRIELVHTHGYKDTVLGLIAARIAGVPYAV